MLALEVLDEEEKYSQRCIDGVFRPPNHHSVLCKCGRIESNNTRIKVYRRTP